MIKYDMFKEMAEALDKKIDRLWNWETLWCCKYCGACYQELADDINGCQECGTPNSMKKKRVYCHPFSDEVYSKEQLLHLQGMTTKQGLERLEKC